MHPAPKHLPNYTEDVQIQVRPWARKGSTAGPGCSTTSPSDWAIWPGRVSGMRIISGGKTCCIEFMANHNRRIRTLNPWVPKKGHMLYSRKFHNIWKIVPGIFLSPIPTTGHHMTKWSEMLIMIWAPKQFIVIWNCYVSGQKLAGPEGIFKLLEQEWTIFPWTHHCYISVLLLARTEGYMEGRFWLTDQEERGHVWFIAQHVSAC